MGVVYVDAIVYGRTSGHDWEFTDYIGFGSGNIKAGSFTSDIAVTPTTRFYYCNFDKCGALFFIAATSSSLSITFCNTTRTTYPGSNSVQLTGSINSTGTLECKFNSFSDTVLFNGPHSWEVENNYFAKSSPTITQGVATGTTGAGFKSYRRNYLGVTGADSREIEGDLTNCYFNSDLGIANYGSLNWLAWNSARTMQNCVLDNSDKTSAEGDFIMPCGNSTLKAAGTTHHYISNILLPSAHGGSMGKPLSLYWGIANVNIEIKNSTTVTYKNSDSPETALGLGELIDGSGDTDASIGHHVNEVVSFKNNMNWTPASKTPGWFAVRQQSSMQDLLSASNTNYNWGWNLDAGSDGNGFHTWPSRRVNNQFSTGTPNPNGSYAAGDPQFLDSSRCFVSYDTHRLCNTATAWLSSNSYSVGDIVSAADSTMYSNLTINYRCLTAHVAGVDSRPGTGTSWRTYWEYSSSYRLRENTYRVQDLIDWVRKGYSPRNTAVATYGESGTFAGAVDPALTIELPPVINQFIAERITDDSVRVFASVTNGSSNVSAYLLSLDAVTPLATDSRWNSVLPTTYNTLGVANSQLFIFAKDVNNFISFPQIAVFAGLPAVITSENVSAEANAVTSTVDVFVQAVPPNTIVENVSATANAVTATVDVFVQAAPPSSIVENVSATANSTTSVSEINNLVDTITAMATAGTQAVDIAAYLQDFITTITANTEAREVQNFADTITAMATTGAQAVDIAAYLQDFITTITANTEANEVKTSAENVSAIASSTTSVTEINNFADTITAMATAGAQAVDIAAYLQDFITTITAKAEVRETQTTNDMVTSDSSVGVSVVDVFIKAHIDVTTDRNEYSRFEPGRSIIKARMQALEGAGDGKITVELRRTTGPVVATATIIVDHLQPIRKEIAFDTSAIIDTDGIPTCVRGQYEIHVTSGDIAATSRPFYISVITVPEFRSTYLKGLPLLSSNVLAARKQPSSVTGVTIVRVSEGSRPGFKPLLFSAASRSLSWNNGPAITITSSDEILPGSLGDYVEVEIDDFILPNDDASESILIDKDTITDEDLRREIERGVDEVEHDLDMNIEPLRVATEPYYSNPEPGEWFDKKQQPVAYYSRDFNMRGMGWHLDLAINQLLKVDKVEGFIGSDRVLQISSGAYTCQKKAGMLDVMPYSGQYVVNYLFFVQMQFWGNREFIAGFWRWKGKAGIDHMEGDLMRALAYKAAIPVLIKAGQAARDGITSLSTSKDGVSVSQSAAGGAGGLYGAAVTEYKQWLDTNMKQTIKRYRGLSMVVL
jgi:hypothetical protein